MKPISDEVKVIGLKAIIPLELKYKLDYELNLPDEYQPIRAHLEGLTAKVTTAGTGAESQQFPMSIGNIVGPPGIAHEEDRLGRMEASLANLASLELGPALAQ